MIMTVKRSRVALFVICNGITVSEKKLLYVVNWYKDTISGDTYDHKAQ